MNFVGLIIVDRALIGMLRVIVFRVVVLRVVVLRVVVVVVILRHAGYGYKADDFVCRL